MENPCLVNVVETLAETNKIILGIYSMRMAFGSSLSSRNICRLGQSVGCIFVIVP